MDGTRRARTARLGAAAGAAAIGLAVGGPLSMSNAAATTRPAAAPACLLCAPTAPPTPAPSPTAAPAQGNVVSTVGTVVGGTITGVGGVLASTVSGAGTVVASAVTGVGTTLDQLTGGTVAGPVDGVTGAVSGVVSGVTGTLGDTVSGVTGTLGGTVTNVSGSLGGTLGTVGHKPATGGKPAGATTTGTAAGLTVASRPSGTHTTPTVVLPPAHQPTSSDALAATLADTFGPAHPRQLDLGAAANGTSAPSVDGGDPPALTHLDVGTPQLSSWAAIAAIGLICAVGTGHLVVGQRRAGLRASQPPHSTA